jgi:hypothetical protein
VHDIVANVADLSEFISKCLAINLYCERRPLLRILKQTNVLTEPHSGSCDLRTTIRKVFLFVQKHSFLETSIWTRIIRS